jgi:hypothetical protein
MLNAKDMIPHAIGSPALVYTNFSLYFYSVLLHSFLFGTYEEFVLVSAETGITFGWVVTLCMGGCGFKCQPRKWLLWFFSVRQVLRLYLIAGHDYIYNFCKSFVSVCHLILIQLSVISHVFEMYCLMEVFCYLKQFLQIQYVLRILS